MSKIPTQIVKFSISNGNDKLVGHGNEVTLPTIEQLTDTASLAGGDVDVPGMRTNNITLEIPFNVFDKEAGGLLKVSKTNTVILRAAEQEIQDNTHEFSYKGLKVTAKGLANSIELGTLKKPGKMDSIVKLTLTYIKVEDNNGYVFLEHDKLNGTYIVNNEDAAAEFQQYL